jgi:hypothetical protein
MNPKDIPIFSGAACALALSGTSSGKDLKNRILSSLWINLSVIFIIGVRPGASYLLFLILFIQWWQAVDKVHFLRIIAYGTPAIVYCYLVSATSKEYGFSWLWVTIQKSYEFVAWQGTMLLWGKAFNTPISPFYQIGVLSSQVPIFIFGLISVAVFTKISRYKGIDLGFKSVGRKILFHSKNPLLIPPFILVSLLTYIMLTAPMLYDDARQTLFVWAFLIPTTLLLIRYLTLNLKSKIVFVFAFLPIILPIIDSFKLAPYTYTYRNEISRFIAPQGFETDYWGLSGKESANWIAANNPKKLGILSNPLVVFQSFTPKPWLNPENQLPQEYIYQQIRRPFGVPDILTQCKLIHTVSRKPLIGDALVMGTVRYCNDGGTK